MHLLQQPILGTYWEIPTTKTSIQIPILVFEFRFPIIKKKGDDLTVNGKYDPLYQYLLKQTDAKLILSFDEIEKHPGEKLTDSAHEHNAWWGNRKTGQHPYSKAWQAAGYVTVDVESSRKRKQMKFKKI